MNIMIFIDFNKAFDSLLWDFIVNCLEAFNFGTNFVSWVGTFYKNIQNTIHQITFISSVVHDKAILFCPIFLLSQLRF